MYPSARPLCPGLEEMAASNRPLLNICKCVWKVSRVRCMYVCVESVKERERVREKRSFFSHQLGNWTYMLYSSTGEHRVSSLCSTVSVTRNSMFRRTKEYYHMRKGDIKAKESFVPLWVLRRALWSCISSSISSQRSSISWHPPQRHPWLFPSSSYQE